MGEIGRPQGSSNGRQSWRQVSCSTTYEDGADAQTRPGQARVHFSLPSTDSEELQIAFHNQLMLLCQASLQSFSEAMKTRRPRKEKNQFPPRQADAELLAATPPAHLEARQGGRRGRSASFGKSAHQSGSAAPRTSRASPFSSASRVKGRCAAPFPRRRASRVKGRSTPPPARRVNAHDPHQD